MNILDKYVARHVVVGSFMALVVLVAVDLVFAFGAELNNIGEGDYDTLKSLLHVSLTTPRRVYDLIPLAAIVGSMMTLGGLASDSEFVAMRSAGVSIARVALSMCKGGLVLVLLALALSEGVIPFSEPYAQQLRTFAQTRATAVDNEHGIWVRDGSNFIKIAQLRRDGQLRQLDIYELDDDFRLRMQTRADSAVFQDGAWLLSDVEQAEILPDAVRVRRHAQLKWPVLLNPQLLDVLAVKPEQLPLWRLMGYINYLEANDLTTKPYEFAYWRKLSAPFAIIVMLLLSVPFIFGPQRMVGAGQRILIGIVIGIGYFLFAHVVARVGEVYDFSPLLSGVAPAALFFVVGFWALRWSR